MWSPHSIDNGRRAGLLLLALVALGGCASGPKPAADGSGETGANGKPLVTREVTPEAQTLLLETARNSSGELQSEAIQTGRVQTLLIDQA